MTQREIQQLRDAYDQAQENVNALRSIGYPTARAQANADRIAAKLIRANEQHPALVRH